ncbi:integrin alpha-M-like protein [Labeo rohita]|uniref:Integrin alpha-M-like protein n=1 Tax=Labeo rohita TaxID=84645 RepID=A0A498P1V1_LABRO|nr:integrin alpha-M-like protein [Labeo rohita]
MINSFINHDTQVGNAFNFDEATQELAIIASSPTNKHVFKVTDFDALDSIREQLKENIIAIEGYSLAIATMSGTKYAVMGAPRHKHKGQVTVSRIDIPSNLQELDPPKPQIGSYFGAELCVVDLNSDSRTDLLLVSAPTYIEPDQEGKVFVYTFDRRPYFIFSGTVLVGMAGQRGRFGSSLASPADLNGDGYMDVLIGAPLEEDGQGSIYIFNGGAYQINTTYSQRIAGLSVQPGLRFFGISLSQSCPDQSADNLPDIAVGSMGAVLLLRSRPIMYLETKIVSLSLSCRDNYKRKNACLTANINYTITLDAKRQKYRAYFTPKNRFNNSGFSEDALNPLSNQLTFTFEGLPSATLQNMRPILLPGIKNTTDHNGRVECVSLDSEQKGSFGETTCHISKPILKGNSQAVFHITYSINKESTFDQNVIFTARINRHEDSTLYINFTAQKNDIDKPVKQILKVENDFRELSFKVFIRVPVMLGDKSIWTNKNIEIPDCVKQRDLQPVITDFVKVIKKDHVVNCSVAACAEFSCDNTLIKNERKFYNITGNVSSGWIEQVFDF